MSIIPIICYQYMQDQENRRKEEEEEKTKEKNQEESKNKATNPMYKTTMQELNRAYQQYIKEKKV